MEINPNAAIIKALKAQAGPAASEMAKSQVQLMFDTSMLTSGFIIENSGEFADRIFAMVRQPQTQSNPAPVDTDRPNTSP
eukprot:6572497-Pyramimonas_sp.AAC.1